MTDQVGDHLRRGRRDQEKHTDEQRQGAKAFKADLTGTGKLIQHGKQQYAQQVVDHRRAQHDLALATVLTPHVAQNPHGHTNTRGR